MTDALKASVFFWAKESPILGAHGCARKVFSHQDDGMPRNTWMCGNGLLFPKIK